jgi:hypothetical protein
VRSNRAILQERPRAEIFFVPIRRVAQGIQGGGVRVQNESRGITAFKDTRLVLKSGSRNSTSSLTRTRIDGGELIVYSDGVKNRLVTNFGGFSFSVEALIGKAREGHKPKGP